MSAISRSSEPSAPNTLKPRPDFGEQKAKKQEENNMVSSFHRLFHVTYTLRMALKVLHIVDGESTGGSLRQAGFRKNGDILPWRDALYTGPVPRGLTLRQLSRLRSRFWTGKSTTEFEKRDAALARHADYDEVVLWFEPTSLCQLSLVQLLAWFGEHGRSKTR